MVLARLTAGVFLGVLSAGALAAAPEAPLIAIDVGHSLAKPGSTSARGRPEFEFNRELAAAVDRALHLYGFRTQLIGEQGDMTGLTDRTKAAAGADFFLSIHHDSVQPQYLQTWIVGEEKQKWTDRFSGYSLFVSRKNQHLKKSLACAQAIGEAMRMAGQTPSLHHAEPIKGENRPLADKINGVYYFDDLVVLKTASSPAVLVEAGIIVNKHDELGLREPATKRRIAFAIASGLRDCLNAPATISGRG
ncbi:MAG: N-acetylmuramoyl-L-alanine amidase [Rhodospirillales bacterium]|nr:N-acetylmuramoyl-L-alanine amidase [Rhodospirillales bacterium]